MTKIVKESLIKEDAMGGVSTPMATLNNTPGMGSVVPPGANGKPGSGDNFNPKRKKGKKNPVFDKPATQAANPKKSTIKTFQVPKKLKENNLNPYDKVGKLMADEMDVEEPFEPLDSQTNTIKQKKFKTEESMMSLTDFIKINEEQETGDKEALKYANGKNELKKIGIAFVYKMIDEKHQIAFIKDKPEDVEEKLKGDGWVKGESETQKTGKIDKYTKDDRVLSIFTGEFDHPYVTVLEAKPKEEGPEEPPKL